MNDRTELERVSTVVKPPGETRAPWDPGRIADETRARWPRIKKPREWRIKHRRLPDWYVHTMWPNAGAGRDEAPYPFDSAREAFKARNGFCEPADWMVVRRGVAS